MKALNKPTMKGIILAGGTGTRLQPATKVINKHMIPILNKPMIMYPIETLKHLGVTDILIVSGGGHIGGIADFLGDGSAFGINFTYKVQKEAGGIGQALGLAKDFVGNNPVAVILGDNVFENNNLIKVLPGAGKKGAQFFFSVQQMNYRFGVPVLDGKVIKKIEEKPTSPKSNLAVTGLYIYPPNVFAIIPSLKPSKRGEIEITDVNNWYIKQGKYAYSILTEFWSDAGTPESLKDVTDWAYKKYFEF
jgi:glucose-1-phosphate thymidylyltransferase